MANTQQCVCYGTTLISTLRYTYIKLDVLKPKKILLINIQRCDLGTRNAWSQLTLVGWPTLDQSRMVTLARAHENKYWR